MFPELSSTTRAQRGLILALLIVGAVLRLVPWARAPSLQNDEIKLALNLGTHGPAALLQPLEHEQLAPVGFLLVAKAAVTAGGMNERALRFPSLLASLALLLCMVPLALRLLRPPEALIAVGLVATSPLLVAYTNVFKPYELEAFLAVAVPLLLARGGLARAVVVGVAVAATATSSLFVLPVPVVLAAARARRPRLAVVAATAAWVATFGVLYLVVYRAVASLPYMTRFWKGAMLTLDGGLQPLVRLGERLGRGGGRDLALVAGVLLLVALLVAGAVSLVRRLGWARAATVIAPGLLCLGASVAGRYPLVGRTLLFLVPSFALVAAEGLGLVVRPLRRARGAALAVLGVVAVGAGAVASVPVAFARRIPEIREAVAALAAGLRPGDSVYLSARSVEPWLYYTMDWSQPDLVAYRWLSSVGSVTGPSHENAPSRGHAVVAEGDALVLPWRGARIFVGVASGIELIMPSGKVRPTPDPGFFENEVRRLADLRGGTLWVLHFNDFERAHRQLTARLAERFARATQPFRYVNANLSSFTLPK